MGCMSCIRCVDLCLLVTFNHLVTPVILRTSNHHREANGLGTSCFTRGSGRRGARHKDMLKLEESIKQLHQLFTDMAVMVESQVSE